MQKSVCAFAGEHDFIAFCIHAHGQMGWLAIFRLGFTGELTAGSHDLLGTCDDVWDLKAEPSPGAIAFAPSMDADDALTNGYFTDDVVLFQNAATEDGDIELDGAIHIGSPDDVFKAFYFHGGFLSHSSRL